MTAAAIAALARAIGCTPQTWPQCYHYLGMHEWDCLLPDPDDETADLRPWIGPCVEFLTQGYIVQLGKDSVQLFGTRAGITRLLVSVDAATIAAALVAACRAVAEQQETTND